MDWLWFNFLIPHNLFVHLECWSGEARGKKMQKGFWVIRKARNARIFENHIKMWRRWSKRFRCCLEDGC